MLYTTTSGSLSIIQTARWVYISFDKFTDANQYTRRLGCMGSSLYTLHGLMLFRDHSSSLSLSFICRICCGYDVMLDGWVEFLLFLYLLFLLYSPRKALRAKIHTTHWRKERKGKKKKTRFFGRSLWNPKRNKSSYHFTRSDKSLALQPIKNVFPTFSFLYPI